MKILLVDDHSIVRKSLHFVIHSDFPDADVREAGNGETCIDSMKKERFDLVVMDLNLPDTDGISLTEWIRERYPDQSILFFSSSPTSIYAKKLYQMGIMGYLNKQAPVTEFSKALKIILIDKKQYLDDEFKNILAEEFLNKTPANPLDKLTTRELLIAQLMANGKTFDEIAAHLNIEASTIRTYKSRIFQKLEVGNLHDFLAKAKLYKLL
jgi:two-component system, NarL family, invasion response regulator UvrY